MARGALLIVCATLVSVAGCGARAKRPSPANAAPVTPSGPAEHLLALLPEGAQLVAEVDLPRLRANPTIGPLVAKLLGDGGIPILSGFAEADLVTFAAYGLGTTEAATITLMTAKAPISGTTRIADGIYAVGPTSWVSQVEARAAIEASGTPLTVPQKLIDLRSRAMPPRAPGASLRISAQLAFDARIALSRMTGIEGAPGRLGVWADVIDDFGIIVDADATDPGEKSIKRSVARMKATMRAALATLARDPTIIALGLPSSLEQAKVITRGSWVRTIVVIGPRHLQRVVERASKVLDQPAS